MSRSLNFAVPTAAYYRFGDGAMEPNVLFQPVLVKYLIEMLKAWKRVRTKLERHFGKAASSFEAAETPNRPTDDNCWCLTYHQVPILPLHHNPCPTALIKLFLLRLNPIEEPPSRNLTTHLHQYRYRYQHHQYHRLGVRSSQSS